MATLLYRLGKTAYRRWPFFIAGWLVLMIAVGGFAAAFSKPTSDSFSIPGIPSEEAANLQRQLFPDSQDAFDKATVNVVVASGMPAIVSGVFTVVRPAVSKLRTSQTLMVSLYVDGSSSRHVRVMSA